MLFMLRARLANPQNMSNREFYGVWLKEAEAAMAAYKVGVMKGIWKVPGKAEVIAVMDADSADTIEAAVLNLPIWKLGYSHLVTNLELDPTTPV